MQPNNRNNNNTTSTLRTINTNRSRKHHGVPSHGTPWSSISSMIAAGSSVGLTVPDAVCTVSCSWRWAEEPSETCRAIYRNK